MREFKAIKRTSEKTVKSIVEKLGTYYQLPLSVKFDRNARVASIDVAHSAMILPEWLTCANVPRIIFYVNHEMGHIVHFPKTAHYLTYLESFALERGIKNPKTFVNMLSDQLVNNECIANSPFEKEFLCGATEFYKTNYTREKRRGRNAMLWHMGNMYRRCLKAKNKKIVDFRSEIEEKLFELVFHDDRNFEEKYPEIISVARPMFQEKSKAATVCGLSFSSLPPISSPDEFEDWVKKIGRLNKEAVYRVLKDHGIRVLFDYVELQAFETFVIAQKNSEQKARKGNGRGVAFDIWNPTDRVSELAVEKTLSTYGVLLPSVTTLKYGVGGNEKKEAKGTGLQCYIIDRSGSMCNAIDLVATIAWASVRHAKRRGDEIAMLAFSDQYSPEFLLEPTVDYEAARPILENLEASGSTYMAPCLAWLAKYCREKRLKPTAIIFTDTAIFDQEKSLELLREMKQLGGAMLVVSTEEFEEAWLSKAVRGGLVEHFRVDYENLANVQRIVNRVVEIGG